MASVMEPETNQADQPAKTSVLQLDLYSHATLECRDINRTRKFFNEFLGFETVQMAPISFWSRLGGNQIMVVVQSPTKKKDNMPFLNHNGLDVRTDAEVDAAYAKVKEHAEEWDIKKITKPMVSHGTYCFYFYDQDDNAWEILSNPKGGYSWAFELGDQTGKGHLARDFQRPVSTLAQDV